MYAEESDSTSHTNMHRWQPPNHALQRIGVALLAPPAERERSAAEKANMIAFWYETDSIDNPSIFGPLALAFDEVVVPSQKASENSRVYLNHSKLQWVTPRGHPTLRILPCFSSLAPLKAYLQSGVNPREWPEQADREVFIHHAYALSLQTDFTTFLAFAAHNNGFLVGQSSVAEYVDLAAEKAEIDTSTITMNLATALLALSGITVSLPKISTVEEDIVNGLRDKFPEERKQYQTYVRELLQGSYDMIRSDPPIDELRKWATFTAETKIVPALHRLMAAIEKGSDRKLLDRIFVGLSEKLPSIVGDQASGDRPNPVWTRLLAETLEIIAPTLAKTLRERALLSKAFGLGYLYKLKKAAEQLAPAGR